MEGLIEHCQNCQHGRAYRKDFCFVPFNELTTEEQRTLFAYAMEYVTKRE